jgi:hypothetical protein
MVIKKDAINIILVLIPLLLIGTLLANSLTEMITGQLFWNIKPADGIMLFLISCFSYPIAILRSIPAKEK